MTLRLRGSVSRHSKKPSWRFSEGVLNPRPSAEMWRGGGAQKTTGEGLTDQRWGSENAPVTGETQVTPAGPQTRGRPGRASTKGLVCRAYTCVFYPGLRESPENSECRGHTAGSGRRLQQGRGRPGRPRSDASEERQQVARRAEPRARGLEGADEGDLVKSRGSLEGGRGWRLQRGFQTADTPSDECRRHYTERVSLLPGNKRH